MDWVKGRRWCAYDGKGPGQLVEVLAMLLVPHQIPHIGGFQVIETVPRDVLPLQLSDHVHLYQDTTEALVIPQVYPASQMQEARHP